MTAISLAVAAVLVAVAPGLLGLWRPARRTDRPVEQPGRPERTPTSAPRWRRDRLVPSWIDTVERLARDTATGASLPSAIERLETATTTPPVLVSAARSWRAGVPLAEALTTPTAIEDADERLAVGVLRTLARQGGPPDEPLDRVALVLRERRALTEERRAQAAQADLSAKVLAVVPVGFATLTATGDRGTGEFLLRSPLGWSCLVVGLLLDVVGWRWMRRIVGGNR